MNNKAINKIIIMLIIAFIIINFIAFNVKITLVTNKQKEILRERFCLPEDSMIIFTLMPNHFFRPILKVVYIDNGIIRISNSERIGESNDSVFGILTELMNQNIFSYINIVNIIFIIFTILLVIYKVRNQK